MPRKFTDREPDDNAAAASAESDPYEVARAIALRQLTLGPRSRAQLAQALATRNVPDEVAQVVLDRYEEIGLINDAEYARILVRTRHSDRGLARRALRHELSKKGVGEEDAAVALEQVSAEHEEATARELVRKKLRTMNGLPYETMVRRLVGMLARKGYGPGVATSVVRSELRQFADATVDAQAEAFEHLPE